MAEPLDFAEAIKRAIVGAPAIGAVLTGGVYAGDAGIAATPPYLVIDGSAARHAKFSAGKLIDATVTFSAVAKDAATAMLGKRKVREFFDEDQEIECGDGLKVREAKIVTESPFASSRRSAVGLDFVANVTVQFKTWQERLD